MSGPVIDREPEQMHEDRQEPDGLRIVLHGAALAIVGAICQDVGECVTRIVDRVRVHVCNFEYWWIDQATAYRQRAYRVLGSWWDVADGYARWRAEQIAQSRAERGEHDDESTRSA
jgi:hypothetical protein